MTVRPQTLREPMHPVLRNGLIMLLSGMVASVLCAKVYGATLPVDEPVATAPTTDSAAVVPASNASAAAAAAAQLRAMLMGQPVLLGTQPQGAAPQH